MNSNQLVELSQRVEKLKTIDLEAIIAQIYTDTDLQLVKIGNYTGRQLVFFHQKVIANFKEVINSEQWLVLPYQYIANTNGQNTLATNIQFLDGYINSLSIGKFESALIYLELVIHYQISFGIWDKLAKQPSKASDEILKIKSELQLAKQEVFSDLRKYKKRTNEIESLQAEITNFYQQKIQELNNIGTNASNAAQTLQQINNLNTEASTLKEKIAGVSEAQAKLLSDSEIKIKEHQQKIQELIERQDEIQVAESKEFETRKTTLDNYIQRLKEAEETYEEALQYAKDQEFFLAGKREEIIKLTGQAADGSLGHTFNHRRDEIGRNVIIWGGALIFVTIAAIVWAVIVFEAFNSKYNPQWLNILINLIKTTPGFILLGFCMRQYNKERQLQEEYAFKAAVAMTVTAYSDRLTDEKVKESMLLESTQKIYRNPQTLLKKDVPFIAFGSRAMTETLKDISESVKNLKG